MLDQPLCFTIKPYLDTVSHKKKCKQNLHWVQQKKIRTQFVEYDVSICFDPAFPRLCELEIFGSVLHLGQSLHSGTLRFTHLVWYCKQWKPILMFLSVMNVYIEEVCVKA